jgi:hypothetical protein
MKGFDVGDVYNNQSAATIFIECVASTERQRLSGMFRSGRKLVGPAETDIVSDPCPAVIIFFLKNSVVRTGKFIKTDLNF